MSGGIADGQRYRNHTGATLTVVGNAAFRYRVLGPGIWEVETPNPDGPPIVYLATAEHLVDCGYSLIEDPS